MSNGLAVVISGPSGCGKDSVLDIVRKRYPRMKFSISCITRPKRGSDKEDGKYRFLTVDEFKMGLDNGDFLEYNEYLGNYYGTPKDQVVDAINSGDGIFIEVDVNGAASIRKAMPEVLSIFVMPPSIKELRRRLNKRGTDSDGVIQKRIDAALREIPRSEEYDYIVINDDLEEAADKICNIIKAAESSSCRMKYIINEVLKNA